MVPATELGPTHFLTYQKTSGCSPHHKYHARTNSESTKSTPTYATEKTANVPRNSQVCGSSATYRSVPSFKSSNRMFYATQSMQRPISRTAAAAAARNSQICGSSVIYRSVPSFKSSNQMFYATQSIQRPLSRTAAAAAAAAAVFVVWR